ncbi:MAG: hypothetical protein KAW09_09030 [Thermoplasmata archaeon]|nr:hypothetical protein [Thermoplasmata archaeon]
MEKAWIVSLLLSSLVGGGAIAGAVAMDGNMSPEYMMHDDVVGDMTLNEDDACGMDGENHQYRNMQGEQNGDLTRDRIQNQSGECTENQWKHENSDEDNGEYNQYREQKEEKHEEHEEHEEHQRRGCCMGP